MLGRSSSTMAPTSKTKKERHKRLLSSGYLPEELPPPFHSNDLAKYRDSLLMKLQKLPKQKSGDPWFYGFRSSASPIYFPRFSKQDRKHYIINPINFFYLSKEIADNWVELRKQIKSSRVSASQPIFNWTSGRALLRNNFDERDRRTANLSVKNSYLLTSDLARFYHSIYTHALSWAIHGKSTAKKNHSYALLGNRLDLLSRNGQDGQTIGIPVGPETSRILAELIGNAIDRDFLKLTSLDEADFVRFVDDFAIGVSTREAAERLLSSLRRVVHSYELEINEDKTTIRNVYNLEYASWRHEIRSQLPAASGKQAAFERFFDFLRSLSDKNPSANVMRYGIKTSRVSFASAKPWSVIEDFVLLAYRGNPSVLPVVVEVLVNRQSAKNDVDLTKVETFINSNLSRLLETEKHGELAWLLFLASELSIKLKRKRLEGIFELQCPVSALHVCHLHSLGLIDKPIDRSTWNSCLNEGGLSSEMWLYAYEATLKSWTGLASRKFITSHPGFGPLFEKEISFFDKNAHVAPLGVSSKSDILMSKKIKLATKTAAIDFDTFFDADWEAGEEEEFENFEGY